MKPAPFEYARPASVAEALVLLGRAGASPLAGGQSLVATMNMRLARPAVLVDLGTIPELSGIEVANGRVRIGATTRHRALERSPDIAAHAPLIAEAMPLIAHPAIRNRGTIGGSIALADPAAELPACLVALDGAVEVTGPKGTRSVAAGDFFKGVYETDLGEDELVTALEVPAAEKDQRFALMEIARRHGDYALAGIAAAARFDGKTVSDMRLVYLAAGPTPMLAAKAGAALAGNEIGEGTIAAAQEALAGDLDPFDDHNGSAAMKLHLARVLTGRVLARLAEAAG